MDFYRFAEKSAPVAKRPNTTYVTKNYDVHYTTAVSLFCIDILPRLKAGDSYRVQEQDKTPESLRWVPAAGGITAPLTSQAIRASPALKAVPFSLFMSC